MKKTRQAGTTAGRNTALITTPGLRHLTNHLEDHSNGVEDSSIKACGTTQAGQEIPAQHTLCTIRYHRISTAESKRTLAARLSIHLARTLLLPVIMEGVRIRGRRLTSIVILHLLKATRDEEEIRAMTIRNLLPILWRNLVAEIVMLRKGFPTAGKLGGGTGRAANIVPKALIGAL
ncbi:MAG: hypothetical protein LQ343_003711 [Gyalolechia ehrenbergii]|nr:MAG: hypothetical protein LQ343_003711 [Gyalolechia ehrenbergii]